MTVSSSAVRLSTCVVREGLAAIVALALLLGSQAALACPFCTAVQPSLTERREAALAAAVGEVISVGGKQAKFRVHRVLHGQQRLEGKDELVAPVESPLAPGSLALLLAAGDGEAAPGLAWSVEPVDETSLGYLLRAPPLRQPAPQRLRYFAKYLEHADPLLADDAYREFARAPLGDVARAADALDSARLRQWLADPRVPQTRQGLYGLALGLVESPDQRAANERFLRGQIERPADEFRAGFDGVLGGYLLLAGERGLELIERRILHNAKSGVVEARHALTAIRFYHEHGREISRQRLCGAIRPLLARPELAAGVIVDLGRWQDWTALDTVAELYFKPDYEELATRRAVVGYLAHCPQQRAATALDRLRARDPEGVAAAEKALSALGGLKAKQ